VRQQFLGNLDPHVLLSLEQLNERLWHIEAHLTFCPPGGEELRRNGA